MAEYSQDEFQMLVAEVENQGGAHIEGDKCVGEIIKDYEIAGKATPAQTCSCRNNSIFLIPYEGEPKKANKAHAARVCAVCDGLGWMPRFEGAMPENF